MSTPRFSDTPLSPRVYVTTLAALLFLFSALGLMREILVEARAGLDFDLWAGFLAYLTHLLGMSVSGAVLWALWRPPVPSSNGDAPITRVMAAAGHRAHPIPVYHHLSPSMVALLPPPGAAVDILPAALLLMATHPDWRENPDFMEEARESDQWCQDVVGRYSAVLGRLNDGDWWAATAVAAGRAYTAEVEGAPDTVTVLVPEILAVRMSETGLRIRIARSTGTADAWRSALPTLQEAFSGAGIDARRLEVVEGGEDDIVLAFNDRTADPRRHSAPVRNSPGVVPSA